MAATLREMGVNFDIIRNDPWGRQPWTCDLLPHIFPARIGRSSGGAFGSGSAPSSTSSRTPTASAKSCARARSPSRRCSAARIFRMPPSGLPRPRVGLPASERDLSGAGRARRLQVKHHHFGHATGISYMMQNRRALARVAPEIFQDSPVQSLAETPLADHGAAPRKRRRRAAAIPRWCCSRPARAARSLPSRASSRGAWAFRWCRAAIFSCWTIRSA